MRIDPMIEARRLADRYFRTRGIDSPEVQADSFVPRIRMNRHTGAWRSDTLVETALRIIDLSAFDVDDLAENFLHVTLSIEPLSEYDTVTGSPVFGVAYPHSREIVICERAEQYLPLYRTSVVHEIGHVLLHGDRQRTTALNYSPNAKNRPVEEGEADEFMIALLAPLSVIELATGLAAMRAGLHLGEVWQQANTPRGLKQWKQHILPRLVDSLCLSRLLLIIQMTKLKIFTEETAAFHKTYALPNRWRPSKREVATNPGT